MKNTKFQNFPPVRQRPFYLEFAAGYLSATASTLTIDHWQVVVAWVTAYVLPGSFYLYHIIAGWLSTGPPAGVFG
jgi:hypothetical protein